MLGKFNVQNCHNCGRAKSTTHPRYFAERMPIYCPLHGYIEACDTNRDCNDWMPQEENEDDK